MADSQKSILIIDDDQFLLQMYAKKFTDEHYEVQACTSVHDAIVCLEGGFAPLAVVFDLVMPQEDGYALLSQLKEKNLGGGALKVVLTNQGADEEEAKTKAAGADAYIIKSSKVPSEVFNTIDALISGGRKA